MNLSPECLIYFKINFHFQLKNPGTVKEIEEGKKIYKCSLNFLFFLYGGCRTWSVIICRIFAKMRSTLKSGRIFFFYFSLHPPCLNPLWMLLLFFLYLVWNILGIQIIKHLPATNVIVTQLIRRSFSFIFKNFFYSSFFLCVELSDIFWVHLIEF